MCEGVVIPTDKHRCMATFPKLISLYKTRSHFYRVEIWNDITKLSLKLLSRTEGLSTFQRVQSQWSMQDQLEACVLPGAAFTVNHFRWYDRYRMLPPDLTLTLTAHCEALNLSNAIISILLKVNRQECCQKYAQQHHHRLGFCSRWAYKSDSSCSQCLNRSLHASTSAPRVLKESFLHQSTEQ